MQTPIPFFSHMLEAWSKHGLMDLAVEAQGDVEVDLHHTVEDVGIVLGQALRQALGDKRGIVRYGTAFDPDGRGAGPRPRSTSPAGRSSSSACRWPARACRTSTSTCSRSSSAPSRSTPRSRLHVTMHYGHNLHHITEAVFKAVGRALAEATRLNPRIAGILPSTKGDVVIASRRRGEPVIAAVRAAAEGEASL